MPGRGDPQAEQDSQGPRVPPVPSFLAKKGTEVHQAVEETQVEGLLLNKIKERTQCFPSEAFDLIPRDRATSVLSGLLRLPLPPVLTQSAPKLLYC